MTTGQKFIVGMILGYVGYIAWQKIQKTRTTQLAAQLDASDITALPSYDEGMPQVPRMMPMDMIA